MNRLTLLSPTTLWSLVSLLLTHVVICLTLFSTNLFLSYLPLHFYPTGFSLKSHVYIVTPGFLVDTRLKVFLTSFAEPILVFSLSTVVIITGLTVVRL